DVAGCEYAGRRALQLRWAAPAAALADPQSRPCRELHVGRDPGADHDRIRREFEPGPRDYLRHAAVALEALQLVATVHAHAVAFEQLLEEASCARTEAPFKRGLLLHDDRAVLAQHRQRGRDLAADVGAADH